MKPQEGKDLVGAADIKRLSIPAIKDLDALANNKRKA